MPARPPRRRRPHPPESRRRAAAVVAAAAVSGAPSTLHALLTGADPLAATRAAGTLLLPAGASRAALLVAGAAAHMAISAGWGAVLVAVLPRHRPVGWGALAGLAVAAVDLGLVGRRVPAIRSLPPLPQMADHVAFGAVVGAGLRRPGPAAGSGTAARRDRAGGVGGGVPG